MNSWKGFPNESNDHGKYNDWIVERRHDKLMTFDPNNRPRIVKSQWSALRHVSPNRKQEPDFKKRNKELKPNCKAVQSQILFESHDRSSSFSSSFSPKVLFIVLFDKLI